MNDKKICFIACVNNDRYWDECCYYLSELIVPEGYEIDLLEIKEAKSMCSGYNEAMQASDAKYKIYLHQDVFITDRFFLQELIEIFENDPEVGMVGLAGNIKLPADAIVWHGERVHSIYTANNSDKSMLSQKAEYSQEKIRTVEAVDGLLVATSRDIMWREDLFTGWDFYDVSQTQEFLRSGSKVVVPVYQRPIAVHDDGMVLNLSAYDKYRQVFIREYFN